MNGWDHLTEWEWHPTATPLSGRGQGRRHRNQMARATNELERVAAEAAASNEGSGYVPPTATATPSKTGIEDMGDAPEEDGGGGGGGANEGNLLGIEAEDSSDPLGAPFGNTAITSI